MTLAERVRAATTGDGWAWLTRAQADVAADASTLPRWFPAAGRHVGRGPLEAPSPPEDAPLAWTVDDGARALLLDAAGPAVAGELAPLYRHGDTAERRAVLRWIGRAGAGPERPAGALPIVEDALRSNDPRLVAAALGPWAVEHLDLPALRQAVLKCVFLGVSPAGLEGLERRADAELARMLAGYVHERVAAGRDVPAGVWPLIDRHPPERELAALAAEADHPVLERRLAARAVLAARRPAPRPGGAGVSPGEIGHNP